MKERQLSGQLRGMLLAGLLVLFPAVLTGGVLVWLFQVLDGVPPTSWRVGERPATLS